MTAMTKVQTLKDRKAKYLAKYHFRSEPTVRLVARVRAGNEDSDEEPIKLLEVNSATIPAGIMPVFFGATKEMPFASVVVEITEKEYRQLLSGKLFLPDGWSLGETLFEKER